MNNDHIKPVNILIIIVPQTVKLYIELIITMLMSSVMINTEWVSSFVQCI